jgi:hypothetical protein
MVCPRWMGIVENAATMVAVFSSRYFGRPTS